MRRVPVGGATSDCLVCTVYVFWKMARRSNPGRERNTCLCICSCISVYVCLLPCLCLFHINWVQQVVRQFRKEARRKTEFSFLQEKPSKIMGRQNSCRSLKGAGSSSLPDEVKSDPTVLQKTMEGRDFWQMASPTPRQDVLYTHQLFSTFFIMMAFLLIRDYADPLYWQSGCLTYLYTGLQLTFWDEDEMWFSVD